VIAHLRGELLKLAPNEALVDVGGVGYKVHIPLSTYYELQHLEAGARVELHIHTHVREDALALFGFRTELERRLFEKLIGISGVGPRLAQTVLSGMSPHDLIAAVGAGDVKRLASNPGIGKKTAERMVIELRDKVAGLAASPPASSPAADGDLIRALVGLGYKPSAADQAVSAAARENPEAELADLLRLALKRLSRL
jgi:Holliday junction DNA helicase RuvA